MKSLEDNGISYKGTISEFDKLFGKMKGVKERIESEIEKINNSRDILLVEITNSFEEQRIKLNEKEKALKSELDLNVTKLKDKLEKFYTESNNILSSCEKMIKAIQNYEKNNDNNSTIKTLCYISKVNQVNVEIKELLKKPFHNTEISFENDNTLNYKNYYINGIPTPKNIKIEKKDNKVFISWNIDNSVLDLKDIKYLIYLKDNIEESKYESFNTNIIIQEFKPDTEYELKICSVVDGNNGDFCEIKKFRTYTPLFGQLKNDRNLFGNNVGLFGNNINMKKDNNNIFGGVIFGH